MLGTTVEALLREEQEDVLPEWLVNDDGSVTTIQATPVEAATNEKDKPMNDEDARRMVSEGWDDVDKTIGSGGRWLKIADGQTALVNFFGKPKHVKSEFQGREVDRVSFEVFVVGEGCKLWEVSQATYREIREEKDQTKGEFGNMVFRIKRTGVGKETRYRMRQERALTAQEIGARHDSAVELGMTAPEPF